MTFFEKVSFRNESVKFFKQELMSLKKDNISINTINSKTSISFYISIVIYDDEFMSNEISRLKIRISDHDTLKKNDFDYRFESLNFFEVVQNCTKFVENFL